MGGSSTAPPPSDRAKRIAELKAKYRSKRTASAMGGPALPSVPTHRVGGNRPVSDSDKLDDLRARLKNLYNQVEVTTVDSDSEDEE